MHRQSKDYRVDEHLYSACSHPKHVKIEAVLFPREADPAVLEGPAIEQRGERGAEPEGADHSQDE